MDEQKTNQTKPQVLEAYPVTFNVQYPEVSSRLFAALGIPMMLGKVILLLPHIVILYVLQYVAFLVAWFGYWAILFTGKYPKGIFDFVVGINRWQVRVNAWMLSLADKYPPFSLK